MKKLVSITLSMVLAMSLLLPASALSGSSDVEITYRGIKVLVNGVEITPCDGAGRPTEPFIMKSNGTTYLPLRAVANALGLTPEWDAATNTVSLESGEAPNYGSGRPAASHKTVTERISYRNIAIYLDGKKLSTSAEPFIMNSTSATYLPLRAIASALGLTVAWDAATSTVSLNTPSGLEAKAELCVFDASTEKYLRTAASSDLATLSGNEYFSYCVVLKNNSSSPLAVNEAYASIDGGKSLGWSRFTLNPGASIRLHIYNVNMSALQKAGTHSVKWYINGSNVLSHSFTITNSAPTDMSGFWKNVFPFPSASQIAAFTNPNASRSPYIAGWLDISKETRFVEYTADFKADYLPEGTYCCLANWKMDLSELEKTHTNVHTEYSSVHAYAGFQNTVTEKGKASIMSFWDIYATDRYGNDITIRPTLVYPEPDGDDDFGGEGTGAHRIVPYDWKEGCWYRMLLQCSTDPVSGNTLVTQWVCDLGSGAWTRLCCYDTGLKNSCFKGSVAFFLENYIWSLAGEVRSLELKNVRIRLADSGAWQDVEKSYLSSNGGSPKYEGSYAFGANSDRFWMITSGVGGDWYNNGKGQQGAYYTINNTLSGSPY